MKKCQTTGACTKQIEAPGINDLSVYGIPAVGGRQNCAVFVANAAAAYLDKSWFEVVAYGPANLTPNFLMFGPKGPPWSNMPLLAYPPK
jgi:hypothetical protein